MNLFFKEYFSYSRREMRAIQLLVLLIVLVFAAPAVINLVAEKDAVDYSSFEAQISSFEPEIDLPAPVHTKKGIEYFYFNPNNVTKKELMKLGLSSRQASIFINYRKSGAKFIKKEDVGKVYSISKLMYEKLEPYIEIIPPENSKSKILSTTTKADTSNSLTSHTYKIEQVAININEADSVELMRLRGIGPVLARRIINYRKFLGGYYSVKQLLEVYGITDSTFGNIVEHVEVDSAQIQKLDLNTAEFKQLNKHPYISYTDTKAIIKFRDIMGEFKSVNQIIENHLVSDADYERIKYYLNVSR